MAAAQASLRGRWLRQYGTERAFLHRGACRDRHSSSSGCSLAARSRVAWPHRPDGGSARTRFRSRSPPSRGPEREPKAAWPDLSRHPKALQCRCQAGTLNIRAKRGWTAASMPETRQKSAAPAENSAGSRSQLRAPQQLGVDGETIALSDMRTALIAPGSTMPHDARPPAARGIAKMLYPVAHQRF